MRVACGCRSDVAGALRQRDAKEGSRQQPVEELEPFQITFQSFDLTTRRANEGTRSEEFRVLGGQLQGPVALAQSVVVTPQLAQARGQQRGDHGIVRPPLLTAIKVNHRLGPKLEPEADDRRAVVSPERIGAQGQHLPVMVEGVSRG